MHKPLESSTAHNGTVETQLWHIPCAHILARAMGDVVQAHVGIFYRCRHTMHCSEHIRLLLRNDEDYLANTGQ